ncbi:MAG: heavy metal translocating P-type ATPase [Paracoccaceae bacterium]
MSELNSSISEKLGSAAMRKTKGTCSHCHLPVMSLGIERNIAGTGTRLFCCYGCHLAFQVGHGYMEESTTTWLLIRIGIGAFLAMNIMLLSLLIYSGTFSEADRLVQRAIIYLIWLLSTPVVIILGGPFIREAIRGALETRITTDALISIAVLVAYGYSSVAAINGSDDVYFDTVTMVLVLFTVGRFLEASGRSQAVRDLEPIFLAEHGSASVITKDGLKVIQISNILPGMQLRCIPGERIAVDGVIIEGYSDVNEASITGESSPAAKKPGSLVSAGCINLSGVLILECSTPASESTWAIISRSLRESLKSPTSIQQLADRWASIFVPGVLALAIGTFLVWSVDHPFSQSMTVSLAVLVVACPCALGLAAPLATTIGISLLAERGCLIRDGAVLEVLATTKGVAFDKTGTLTTGSPELFMIKTGIETEDEVLRVAASLEIASLHPIAAAIILEATNRNLNLYSLVNHKAIPGLGIEAYVDGVHVAVGSSLMINHLDWEFSDQISSHLELLNDKPYTLVMVAWSGSVRGILVFTDFLHPQAHKVIKVLKDDGMFTALLSGDRTTISKKIAQDVGVDYVEAALLPNEKVAAVERLRNLYGCMIMVGDGINDGLALVEADVGIAVSGATDLARESADIVLPKDGIHLIPWVIKISQEVRKTIIVNLAGAFSYNAIAISLAATGWLQPVAAALLMVTSSLAIIINSLRLKSLSSKMTM